MPELPEVEGLVRELAPAAIGRTIRTVTVSDIVIESKAQGKEAILKGMSTERFVKEMVGMTITDVTRRSKYIYFDVVKEDSAYLSCQSSWYVGGLVWVRSIDEVTEWKFRKHIHVILEMEDGGLLVYSDIRRFGELRLLDWSNPPLLRMAPEPFDQEACAHYLEYSATPKYAKKAIKEVIMDGQVISGCGNIYATEALFKMKIHPGRTAERISLKRKTELFHVIVDILQESIDAGGSTISDYRKIDGESGTMQHRLKMYGRKSCPSCNAVTKSMKIAARASVYCPSCQR